MPNTYISGPMTGIEHFNYPAFFAAERDLKRLDPTGTIFNPARIDCERVGYVLSKPGYVGANSVISAALAVTSKDKASRGEMLAVDLAWIAEHADRVVVLDGWSESSGARAEVATARAVKIPVFYLDEFGELAEVVAEIGVTTRAFTVTGPPPSVGVSLRGRLQPPFHPMKAKDIPVPVAKFVQDVLKPEMHTDAEWAERRNAANALLAQSLDPAKFGLDDKGEVRTTSATGGQKGAKLAAFDQISPEVLRLVAEHFGLGARKYAPHNFRRQYPWSLSFSALMRHAWAAWGGEDYDNHLPECPADCVDHTGSLHWVAAIWHAMNLAELTLHKDQNPDYDDRFTYPEVESAPDFDGETEEA